MDNTPAQDVLGYASKTQHSFRLPARTILKLALLVAAVMLVVWVLSPFSPNLGLPIGYYGKLNRIKSRVDDLPGVAVVGVHANYDVTVEEFSVDVLVHAMHRASISFPDLPMPQLVTIVEKWRTNVLPTYQKPGS